MSVEYMIRTGVSAFVKIVSVSVMIDLIKHIDKQGNVEKMG